MRNVITEQIIPAMKQRVMSSFVMVLAGCFAFRSHCTRGIPSYMARFGSPPTLGRSIRGSFWRVVPAAQICIHAHAPGTFYNLGSS
jgi:hypothetical protein